LTTTLSSFTQGRDNNFNLLRFVAASLVLISHSYVLASGDEHSEPLREQLGVTWGSIAVDVFFVTSGFLIARSYVMRKSLLIFFWSRFLRIFPALIIAVFFSSFVVGLIFTELPFRDYFGSFQLYKYVLKNCVVFIGAEYDLPGVFLETPYPRAVNGSLWTLPNEVRLYALLVLVLSILKYLQIKISFLKIPVMLFLIVLAVLTMNILNHYVDFYSGRFLGLFYMFFLGGLCYFYQEKIPLTTPFFLVVLILLILSSVNRDFFYLIYLMSLPYIIFYLAYVPNGKIRLFNQLGDYSYGIYIYAFPVQQSLVSIMPGISISKMILFASLITLLLSILSWKFVEKKALSYKSNAPYFSKFFERA
jgi:peptidoglycan/LPS O-acetylase OafA/YrhL